MRHVLETLTIPRVPILSIFLSMLENSAIFVLHVIAVRLNIRHHIGHLRISEIELITNQMWGPPRLEVIHNAVKCQPTTGNRSPAAGPDNSRLWSCLFGHRFALFPGLWHDLRVRNPMLCYNTFAKL